MLDHLELQIEERGLGAAIVETAFFGKTYGEAMTLLVEARNYLKRIAEICEVPVDMVSTGPDRDETIVLRHPFKV